MKTEKLIATLKNSLVTEESGTEMNPYQMREVMAGLVKSYKQDIKEAQKNLLSAM